MNLLITGGAGFIGSNFIRYILKVNPGWKIVNYDKLTYAGNPENLLDLQNLPGYSFVRGDISDSAALSQVIQDHHIEAVINYAAETHVDRSINDPEAFLKTNVLGVHCLLEQVRKFKLKKFIQISTDEVFGSLAQGKFNEESSFHPSSPYAAAKAGGDLLVQAYFTTYTTPVIVTHSSNIYGPYQYPEKLLPLFITNLLEDKTVPLYGDGHHVREWLYIEDHCRAIEAILEHGVPGQVYNIGSGEEKTNVQVTEALLALFGKSTDQISFVPDRPGHDVRYAVDSQKISRELGWQPQVSFEQGLAATVEWYKQNPLWWSKIKNGEFKNYYAAQYLNYN